MSTHEAYLNSPLKTEEEFGEINERVLERMIEDHFDKPTSAAVQQRVRCLRKVGDALEQLLDVVRMPAYWKRLRQQPSEVRKHAELLMRIEDTCTKKMGELIASVGETNTVPKKVPIPSQKGQQPEANKEQPTR